MARMITIVTLALGLCTAFGQSRENNSLDSLMEHFVTNTEDAMALHRNLAFLGLPSNLDVERVTLDEPIRKYYIENDTTRLKSGKYRINSIIRPINGWKVPFKYDGRYCSSFEIEEIAGKFTISDLKAGDSAKWNQVEKRVEKNTRRNAKLLRYGPMSFLHFPAIDEYNLLPLHPFYDLDTSSEEAANSPLGINTERVREQLKEDIIKGHQAKRVRNQK